MSGLDLPFTSLCDWCRIGGDGGGGGGGGGLGGAARARTETASLINCCWFLLVVLRVVRLLLAMEGTGEKHEGTATGNEFKLELQ